MSVFVDTSALLAAFNRQDAAHEPAGTALRTLLESGEDLVSTNYVVLETLTLVQRRLGMDALWAIVQDFIPCLSVEWLDEEIHQNALEKVFEADRRQLSLVDCTSFEVMRRRGLTRAFSIDRHFAEQGFELIPA